MEWRQLRWHSAPALGPGTCARASAPHQGLLALPWPLGPWPSPCQDPVPKGPTPSRTSPNIAGLHGAPSLSSALTPPPRHELAWGPTPSCLQRSWGQASGAWGIPAQCVGSWGGGLPATGPEPPPPNLEVPGRGPSWHGVGLGLLHHALTTALRLQIPQSPAGQGAVAILRTRPPPTPAPSGPCPNPGPVLAVLLCELGRAPCPPGDCFPFCELGGLSGDEYLLSFFLAHQLCFRAWGSKVPRGDVGGHWGSQGRWH